MGAPRDHLAMGVLDGQDPVSFDAERPETCQLQLLTGHRLDRVSPDLRDLHPRPGADGRLGASQLAEKLLAPAAAVGPSCCLLRSPVPRSGFREREGPSVGRVGSGAPTAMMANNRIQSGSTHFATGRRWIRS